MKLQRYWRYKTQLCTSRELRDAGVSPLRAIDLGRCASAEEARRRGAELTYDESLVIAHNVRIACDSGRGARVGLSRTMIETLRGGEHVTVRDRLGEFLCGYAPLEGDDDD